MQPIRGRGPDPIAHDIFVSHSSSDAPVALAIVNALESSGIRCWVAPRDIEGGQIWAQAIMTAIENARALVVVFSSHANRSAHVLTEVDTAVRQGCIVVPFRIEAVDPEGALAYHLRTRHWLDALTPELEGHIRRLVDTMSRLLKDAPDSKESPSQPWLRTTPPAQPDPPPPGPPRRWRRTGARIGLVIAGVMAVGAILMSLGRGTGQFEIRDASVPSEPVTLPVRVSGVRFFEAGKEMPATGAREHATRFAAGASRYIYVQLDLEHGVSPREVRVPITCTITDAEGAVLTTMTATGRIQPEWTGSNWASGWGTEGGGTWQSGRYHADCSYGAKSIATGDFEVVGGGAAPAPPVPAGAERLDSRIPELNGRVAAIRYFPDFAGPLTARPDRRYASVFSASDLLYLGIELELDYAAVERKLSIESICVITTADGASFGTMTLPINPEVGWTGSYTAGSFGWQEPGRWSQGTYRIACRVNGRLVARGAVNVR
ncbi:MAG: toll/interleukin-1 receptor domain-containing protein [Gemmatimonadota bacterium]|nr:toll/interleukin-1 receptor domain-containing protein [Gemmatimonadota bacterium]